MVKNKRLLLRHLARNWIKSAHRSLDCAGAEHASPQLIKALVAELKEARKAHQQAEELLAMDA